MNILDKLNKIYGKYLYVIIPSMTIIIAVFEVAYEISNGDSMHILAYVIMGFVSLAFCGFYLMSGKQKTGYCLIELYLFFYTVFLMLDNHLHFGDIVWIIFLQCAVFCMFFIIFYNRKER